MSPITKEFHLSLIRLLKGMLTAWERWTQETYLASLPDGTVDDALKILSPKGKKPD